MADTSAGPDARRDGRMDIGAGRSALRRRADAGAPALARRFGEALRVGDPDLANTIVDDALSSGLRATAVQSRVIAPAMHWIGELWEKNAISIADEHLATALSYQALSRVYPELMLAAVHKRRVLVAATEGEHHVLGLRMAADALEGGGFDVRFMGADVPAASLLHWIEEHDPAVVALGVTMALGGGVLTRQLQQIHCRHPDIRLVAGGSGVPPALREAAGITFATDTERIVDDVNHALARPQTAHLDAQPTSDGFATHGYTGWFPAPDGVDTREARLASATAATADIARAHARRAFTLEQLAFRDPLTGLWNRRAFEDRYEELLDSTTRPLSTLMIDVDRFKSVNDAHGHDGGDAALVRVARCITAAVRSSDFAARYGGDEFAVLLPGAGISEAVASAERIRSFVRAELADLGVSVSVGVNTADGGNRRQATIDADVALYRAKQQGRDQVALAFLDPSL